MVKLLSFALALLVLMGCPLAFAQSRAETRAARRLWTEGRAAADAGDLQEALARFERSFALVERASTALSIAVVAMELDDPDRALAALDDLERVADPSRDAELLASGARVRAEAEALVAARTPPPAPQPTPEPLAAEPVAEPSSRPDAGALAGPLVVLGLGLAAIGAAVGTYIASQDALSQRDVLCPGQACSSASDLERAVSLHDEASTLNTASGALDVVGAVLLAGGATWLVLALVLDDDGDVEVALGPGGLVVAGRFP